MKKIIITANLLLIFNFTIISESFFEQGKTLLLNNQLKDAVMMFEAAVEQEPSNPDSYIYIGYIYEIKKDYQSAVDALNRGLENTDGQDYIFYFNMGNNYFKAGEYEKAADMFSKAMQSKSGFTEPYLNRANCRLQTQDFNLALRDYKLYITMQPDAPQAEQVKKLIASIENDITTAKKREEQEVQRKKIEEARQKELLNSVLNSLDNVSEDVTNFTAGSAGIEDMDIELDIEE
ncbi:MAG: tetratricopeptide repeat protein [Spirochaetales bacterium]|nr:tetratricopeptide repeat protein [Spirochaetales bacterium]